MDCADPVDMPTGTVVAAGTVFINKIPAAKQGNQIVGVDLHIILIPSPAGPIPTPLPHPFTGIIDGSCEPTVKIMGMPAAVLGSTATNTPPHIPQGGMFQKPPMNRAQIIVGSPNVFIGSGSGGGGGSGSGSVSGFFGGVFNHTFETTDISSSPGEGHYLDVTVFDNGDNLMIGPRYSLTDTNDKIDDGALSGPVRRYRIPEGQGSVALRDIVRVSWSVETELKPGEPIKLQIKTEGMDDGTPVVFDIWERDANKEDRFVAKIDTETISGNRAEATWAYVLSESDGAASPMSGDYSKPDYYYVVEAGLIKKRSCILACVTDLEIELKYENGDPVADEPYRLYLTTGEIRAGTLDADGYAKKTGVAPKDAVIVFERLSLQIKGTCEMVLADGSNVYVPVTPEPTADHLRWSAGTAKPGEPVIMSADFENVNQGTPVTFTVYEYDEGGGHKKAAIIERDFQGDGLKVPWAYPEAYQEGRSETGAPTFPAFFFTVRVCDKEFGKDQESSFVRHYLAVSTIEVVFENGTSGVKVALSGEKTYVETSDAGGKVTFNNVLVGEYSLKILS